MTTASVTMSVLHGIDPRLEVVEKPRPDAPGWDWIVRFGGVPDSAARRLPSRDSAQQYAREMTEILDGEDSWHRFVPSLRDWQEATGE